MSTSRRSEETNNNDAHHFFKIILIGDSAVGKSNLLSRFCHNKFTLEFNSTVGVEFTTKTLIIDGTPIMAQIWDASGHTKVRAITDAYYRGAHGALLVYDVTRHITFVNTQKWLAGLRNHADPNMVVTLVGNKSDVRQSVMVLTEVGKSFAEKESLYFVETSALRATHVEKAFVDLVANIYRNQINRKKDMEAHETMALSRSVSISSGNNEPAHYKLKIESFSLLSEAGIEVYESDVFEASGYKWKLEVYPNGSKEEYVNDHISVYLVICDTKNLEKEWEVHVYFKILIYDHIRHNYLTIQGGDGKRTRFHEKKTRWGFRKLISLESFTEAENGYLFGDSCEFGAEVFVVPKYTQTDQCLSMMKPPVTMNTHVWTIPKFSVLKDEPLYSEDFKVGKVKWKLSLYPKGFKTGKNTNLSIFLRPHDVGSDEWKVYAKFKIRVKNQNVAGAHKSEEADHWFCKTAEGWGFPCFMLLSDVHDHRKGFLSNDTLIVEAQISIVGILKHLV
ncbi:putative small GTP-binding protein [Helianthus debilis subsp. tardiflorus]